MKNKQKIDMTKEIEFVENLKTGFYISGSPQEYVKKYDINLAYVEKLLRKSHNYALTRKFFGTSLNLPTEDLRLDYLLYATAKADKEYFLTDLVESGANPNVVFNGKTPLDWSVYYREAGEIKTLIKAGAKVEGVEYTKNGEKLKTKNVFESAVKQFGNPYDIDYDFETVLAFMEFGFKFPEINIASPIGKEYEEILKRMKTIYESPASILNLQDSAFLNEKQANYYKRAAFYGLQREGKTKIKNKTLSQTYVESVKSLTKKINEKIEKAQGRYIATTREAKQKMLARQLKKATKIKE